MLSLTDQLSQYANYHRDPRNILTHFFGVPMIMWAVLALLSRPQWIGGPETWLAVTPAFLICITLGVYYCWLDLRYGLCIATLGLGMLLIAHPLALQSTAVWLGWSIGVFALGWVIQFIGHYYEGRKPAFVDDLWGLVIGPLFVLAEWGFLLNWRLDVQEAITARSGPIRRSSHASSANAQADA